MRSLEMIMRRIQVGLPVTKAELEVARIHIEKCRRSQERFLNTLLIITGLIFVGVIFYGQWFLGSS